MSDRKGTEGTGPLEWVRSLVYVVLASILISAFAVRLVRVDGTSMRDTLQDGDVLLVAGTLLTGPPEDGDIVVLRKESFDEDAIVKRVIATGGQTVDIDFERGEVYVDGTVLEEPYVLGPTLVDEGLRFPVTVPEGHLFVLGDNRNHSSDSRSPALGTVDMRYVIGRAAFLVIPGKDAETKERDLDRIGILEN